MRMSLPEPRSFAGKTYIMVKTKILATLGPASSCPAIIAKMIRAGLAGARINFSHGTHEQHAATIQSAREAARECGTALAIVGDLCGPKIRTGIISSDDNLLRVGDQVIITREIIDGTAKRFSTNYARMIDEVDAGHRVLIDDGLVRLQVLERKSDQLICECQVGGTLSNNKGINLPDSNLTTPTLTEKDRVDLAFAAKQGLDCIALSFVRRPDDVVELREALHRLDSSMQLVVKVETPQAVGHLDAIIELSDMILVARGDLGVEMDLAKVPLVQKDMVDRCNRTGTPVIVATQMLQSMVTNSTPTRAEVSDVANAILDGCDVVMLSAETAVGHDPVGVVRIMAHIAAEAEAFQAGQPRTDLFRIGSPSGNEMTTPAAVARSACIVASDLGAKAIVSRLQAGRAIRLISKYRPSCPVIGLASDDALLRSMGLYYGVIPVRFDGNLNDSETVARLDEWLRENQGLASGDWIVIEAGGARNGPVTGRSIVIHPIGK